VDSWIRRNIDMDSWLRIHEFMVGKKWIYGWRKVYLWLRINRFMVGGKWFNCWGEMDLCLICGFMVGENWNNCW
jgi:hypothetical protein